ncbi:MAG: BfmA/BtgA family mobilization protein [Mariniphaga sp.]|nr:BfmA/BtgA family mobilization protein [Mariniphaga sp.]
MQNDNRKTIFTTISIDKETANLVAKICKRYSLKKGEIVKLAFQYLEKAHINPADAPESVKTELSKISKRQDDIIRFIRHYEEQQLNPMIRTSHSIAVKFDTVARDLSEKVGSEITNSKNTLVNVLKKLDEQFGKVVTVINNQAKQINDLSQVHQKDNKKLLKLISLYSELSACGVMDGKRKENLKAEIMKLINETQ